MTTHRLSMLLTNIVEFGSSGIQRLSRKALAMQRKGIGIVKVTKNPMGGPDRINVSTILKDQPAFNAIKARTNWKELHAASRTVPEGADHGATKASHAAHPYRNWGAGVGWDVASGNYDLEMDKIHKRIAAASGFKLGKKTGQS